MPEFLRRGAPIAACLLFLAAVPAARADCTPPPRPPVMPQGATASDDEMKDGHDKLQVYVKLLETYQSCMDQQVKNAPPDTKPEVKAQWQANADAAIEAAHEIADVYSAQLRAYKARQ
jgi:hypothetical protein